MYPLVEGSVLVLRFFGFLFLLGILAGVLAVFLRTAGVVILALILLLWLFHKWS